MPQITIGLGTHKRPQMLAQTLESLTRLQIPDNCRVQLLLVDNAPEEPSEAVFEHYEERLPFPAHYHQEPQKGLVHMRNSMLTKAGEIGTELLAKLDDDETAHPDWLLHHYNTMLKYDADVVSGRTLRQLPENTPQWMIEGGFFKKGDRPTGIQRPTSSTCNVFFNFKKLCCQWGLCFDEALNFIGGEDILFFRQAHEKGARIIWCNESLVTETIPPSRVNQQWLLKRAYATGTTTAYRHKKLFPAAKAYPKLYLMLLGEYATALSYRLKPASGNVALIQQTRRKHHLHLAKGLWNGLKNMKAADVYKQQHGY